MTNFQKIAIASAALALAACDSNSLDGFGDGGEPIETTTMQLLHASPDAPEVNIYVDGSLRASNVDYKSASDQRSVTVGTHSVRVDAILAGGETATVFGPADVDFAADSITTIAAVGPVAIPLDVAVAVKDDSGPADGAARLFVLHATSGPMGSLPVDVYVDAFSEPNAPIGTSAPFTFDFKETLGPVEVPEGDYQVRVTLQGSPVPVYDSGRVSLGDGDDLTLVAVPNVSGGPAAVTLLAIDDGGAADLLDVNTPTGLRVGHLSPDTGPVDIVVNGGVFLGGVSFPAITGISPLPADTYNVAITAAGNPGAIAFGPADLPLDAGTWYSVFATDLNANLTVDILTDDARPVALYSKVRIYHAAPSAVTESTDTVDIYLTDPALMGDISDVDPALADIPFGANTGYLALEAGSYDVSVTLAGTKTVAIGPATITIDNGGVYTAIARDPLPGSTAFGLAVLVDTLRPPLGAIIIAKVQP
jgi:hypothetical protein